ncbi:MAG TPA: SGNH/GDSL hydrolase family protein [Alphaproteobacteria bacterium]|nr:SGNH/GDSL hydrolase family protein [Alphaproteobacteria bacterium]
MTFDPTLSVLALILLLLGANFLCWLAFRLWPKLLLSENELLAIDYLTRFEHELKPYIPEWFEITAEEWPDFVREYRQGETGPNIYKEFVEFTHPAYKGRYINFDPVGFRHGRNQGPWPVSPQHFNIFFFGGSTTLNVGPDWTAIPSLLQEILNNRRAISRPIRVYNFGRGAWFSIQEKILFELLLMAKAVPDMVIFLDGVNDCYFFDGKPATASIYTNALANLNRDQYETKKSRTAARPKWQKLNEFIGSLPLARAINRAADLYGGRTPLAHEAMYRPIPVAPELIAQCIDRYLENKRQIEAICRDRGIKAMFVWQPTPAYKYDLSRHVALSRHYGLGGHERGAVGYALFARWLESHPAGDSFLWLADIQEDETAPIYLDNMHYTAAFSRKIARHIAEAMFARGFIPAKPLTTPAAAITSDAAQPGAR